jgi:hypothetical protein
MVTVADADAGLVAIEDLLHELARVDRDLAAALGEHEVHLALADDLADRGLRRLEHGIVRVAVVEEVLHGIS